MSRTSPLTVTARRSLPVVAFLALALAAAACGVGTEGTAGGDDAAPSTAAASSGPWTFTDDRPVTVTADEVPQRIVAYEEDAATLMQMGVRPVAIFGSGPMEDNIFLEGLDLTGIESVGEVWGEIDIEKLASLSPDLIVNSFWHQTQSGGGWAFVNRKQLETLEQIAPVVMLESGTSSIGTTDRYLELAESLGADVEAPEVSSQRQAYDDAVVRLEAAVEANPEVQVLAVAPVPGDQVYVADPTTFPDLVDMSAYGVDFLQPEKVDDGAWEYLSWEEAPKYQPDLLLVDSRPFATSFADLRKQPTWDQLDAVRADQLVPWKVPSVESYQQQADRLLVLAEAIERAQVLP